MNIKTIFKWVSIALLITTLILSIITLANYYKYVGIINDLSNTELNLLTKFELQESLNTYSLRTFKLLLWTCYVSIATVIVTITHLILSHKKNPIKIR